MATLLINQRPLLVLSAFALMLAMGGAGCGKGDPAASEGRGRANSGTGGTDDNGPSPLKFSQCMRGQGLSWFPDPDAGGNLDANEPEGLDRTNYEQA